MSVQLEPIPEGTDALARQIVDAAFKVHSALGPGLIESVYQSCMAHEFSKRGLKFKQELALPVVYDGVRIDAGMRLDFLVEDLIVVELKAVEDLLQVHKAQVLTYLKISGKRLGLLINFNVPRIKSGIRRIAL